MDETFQDLREQGKGVVVDRQENILIECNENNSLKKKQIITRERFLNNFQNSTSWRERDESHIIKNNNVINDERNNNNNTFSNKLKSNQNILHSGKKIRNKNCILLPGRDEPEIAVHSFEGTNQPLSSSEVICLKQDIDGEIDYLKRQRLRFLKDSSHGLEKLVKSKERFKEGRPAGTEKTWHENFISSKFKPKKHYERRFEKIVSKHRLPMPCYCGHCSCPCRPRMRMIGPKKSDLCCRNFEKYLRLKDFSVTSLKLKYNPVNQIIPTAYGCFDYAPNCCAYSDYCNSSANSCAGHYCQPCAATCRIHGGGGACSGGDAYYHNCPNATHSCCWRHQRAICASDAESFDCRRQKTDLNVEEVAQERNKERLERQAAKEKARKLEALKGRYPKGEEKNKNIKGTPGTDEESAAIIATQLLAKQKIIQNCNCDSDSDRSYRIKRSKCKSTKKTSCIAKEQAQNYDMLSYGVKNDGRRTGDPCPCQPVECGRQTERTVEKINITEYRTHHKRNKDKASADAKHHKTPNDDKKEKRYEEYINKYKQTSRAQTPKSPRNKSRTERLQNETDTSVGKEKEKQKPSNATSRSPKRSAYRSPSPRDAPVCREAASYTIRYKEFTRDCANQTVKDQCTQFRPMVDASATCDGIFDDSLTLRDRLAIRNAFLNSDRQALDTNNECRTTQTSDRLQALFPPVTYAPIAVRADENNVQSDVLQRDINREIQRRIDEICADDCLKQCSSKPESHIYCSGAESRSSTGEQTPGEEILRQIKDKYPDKSRAKLQTKTMRPEKMLNERVEKPSSPTNDYQSAISPRPLQETSKPQDGPYQKVECKTTTASRTLKQGRSTLFRAYSRTECVSSLPQRGAENWGSFLTRNNQNQNRVDCRSHSDSRQDSQQKIDSRKYSRSNSAPEKSKRSYSPQQAPSQHIPRSREPTQSRSGEQLRNQIDRGSREFSRNNRDVASKQNSHQQINSSKYSKSYSAREKSNRSYSPQRTSSEHISRYGEPIQDRYNEKLGNQIESGPREFSRNNRHSATIQDSRQQMDSKQCKCCSFLEKNNSSYFPQENPSQRISPSRDQYHNRSEGHFKNQTGSDSIEMVRTNRDQNLNQIEIDRTLSAPRHDSQQQIDSRKYCRCCSYSEKTNKSYSPQHTPSQHLPLSRNLNQNYSEEHFRKQTADPDSKELSKTQAEENLLRCDLETRIKFCEEICQQAALLKHGGGDSMSRRSNRIKCDNQQSHQSDDDHRHAVRSSKERFLTKKPCNGQVANQPSSSRNPSPCTASSNYSFVTTYGGSENSDSRRRIPFQRRSRMNIDPVPEYTGCQCMLKTYLDIISAGSQYNDDNCPNCEGLRERGSKGIGSGSGMKDGTGSTGGRDSVRGNRLRVSNIRSKTSCEKRISFRRC